MKRKSWLVVFFLALVSGGCKAVDPYTGEPVAGGGLVAQQPDVSPLTQSVLGSMAGEKRQHRQAVASGVLAGSGAMKGSNYYMNQQQEMLRRELEGTGVQIQNYGEQLRLVMPGSLSFDAGEFQLKTGFLPVLDALARVLVQFDKTRLYVEGFTDSQGSAELNQRLSEQRAMAVMDRLKGSGVDPSRLESSAWGERRPLADNRTAKGRAVNRRVELRIEALR